MEDSSLQASSTQSRGHANKKIAAREKVQRQPMHTAYFQPMMYLETWFITAHLMGE